MMPRSVYDPPVVAGLLLVLAISGANEAAVCEWPTVVSYRAGDRCTGVLVHPRVVLTAAHCLVEDSASRIRFGERFAPFAFDVAVEDCFTNPVFDADWGAGDIAACTLHEPVSEIPPTQILAGCETNALEQGASTVIVGFGATDGDQPDDPDFGIKRYAFTHMASDPTDEGTISIGTGGVAGCTGDSGGPAFVTVSDGSWRVFGLLSGGTGCGPSAGTYVLIHEHLTWLEAVTGYDLTPCHAPDGAWAPGAACRGSALMPLDSGASWDNRCASPLSSPIPHCRTRSSLPPPRPNEPLDDDGFCRVGAPLSSAAWMFIVVPLLRPRGSGRRANVRCAPALRMLPPLRPARPRSRGPRPGLDVHRPRRPPPGGR